MEKQMEFPFMGELNRIEAIKRKSADNYAEKCMDEIAHEAAIEFKKLCSKYKITAEDSKNIYIAAQQF